MNDNIITGNRIRESRKVKKLTQKNLATLLGVVESSIAKYESGKIEIPLSKIKELAKILDVNELYLIGLSDNPKRKPIAPPTFNIDDIKKTVKTTKIPLVGEICAGNGIYTDDNINKMLVIDSDTISADYALSVKGDSMIDSNIFDGDIAFFEKDFIFESGKIYACIIKGEEIGSIKKVHQQGKKLILEASNKDYAPQVYDVQDVDIVGKYKGLLRKE